MTARIAFTYREYEALPDDGQRYEIHDGELCDLSGTEPVDVPPFTGLALVPASLWQ